MTACQRDVVVNPLLTEEAGDIDCDTHHRTQQLVFSPSLYEVSQYQFLFNRMIYDKLEDATDNKGLG